MRDGEASEAGGRGAPSSARSPSATLSDYACLAAFALISGSAFLFTKIAKRSFPPVSLAALRLLVGAAGLTAVRVGVGAQGAGARWFERAWLGRVAVMGLLNCAVPYSLYPYALRHVNVGAAAIVTGSSPLLAQAVTGGGRGWRRAAGLLAGLAGVAAVASRKAIRSREFTWHAVGSYVLLVCAAVCKAAASVWAEKKLGGLSSVQSAWGQTVTAAAMATTAAAVVDYAAPPHPFDFRGVTSQAVAGVLYLGLLASCAVYLVQFRLIRRVGSVRQLSVDFAVPLVALTEGVLFEQEWSGVPQWSIGLEVTGCALLLSGLYLVFHWDSTAGKGEATSRAAGSSGGTVVPDPWPYNRVPEYSE